MAAIPANEKLWNMCIAQAKAKFRVYPSPAASHWVHAHYVQLGGRFVESKKDVDPKSKDKDARRKEREKGKQKR
jgi:hypothetical protein